jgi:hypothetical protein
MLSGYRSIAAGKLFGQGKLCRVCEKQRSVGVFRRTCARFGENLAIRSGLAKSVTLARAATGTTRNESRQSKRANVELPLRRAARPVLRARPREAAP